LSKAKHKKEEIEDEKKQPEALGNQGAEKTEEELLREQLEKSDGKIKETEDRLLRLAAEYDNYRKRTAKEFEYLCQNANENLITKLLDTLDNLERALDSAKNSNDFESFHKGVELIYSHLKELLEKEGLKEIEAVCQPFDPNYHEAVTQCESDQHEEGIVADQMCKGYMLNEKLLRPSKVVVSKGKTKNKE
jgi:molecular chaperone GrpE